MKQDTPVRHVDGVTPNEAGLWTSWRSAHDEQAFAALVGPHLDFATAFARRLGLEPGTADDVVQQTLVALASETRDRPLRVGLKAWLGREVLQRARMARRAAGRRRHHEALAPPRPHAAAPEIETHDAVEAALAALDDDARLVVELRFLHDLSYAEVADIVGRSPLACRLRVHRALAGLRQRLGPNAAVRVALLPLLPLANAGRRIPEAVLAAGSASTGTLVGGLIAMATTTKVAAGVLLVVGLVGGGALALDRLGSPDREPTQVAATGEGAHASAPTLQGLESRAGTPAEPLAATPSSTPPGPKEAGVWVPLGTPIPEGKGSVSGTLTYADGTPARGLRLGLSGSPHVVVVTDEAGRFHIHGDWVAHRNLQIVGPRDYVLGLTGVQLVADQRVELDARIERGLTFEGRLLSERDRTPVAGVLVVLRRPGINSGNMVQAGYGWVETDAEGIFRFDHVPAAAYLLQVDRTEDFEAGEFTFDVRADPERREFLLRMARHIRVRLLNFDAAATGTAIPYHWERNTGGLRPGGKAVLDAQGELKILAPPPGTWTLELNAGPRTPHLRQADMVVTASQPEALELRVPDGVRVEGVLLDADGQPMPAARLMASGDAKATTAADGSFVLPWVAVGKVPFWLMEEGLFTPLASVVAARGEANRVTLRLAGRASVRFKAVHKADVTSGVASLTAANAPLSPTQCYPDAQGVYHFRHLGPGAYTLVVFAGAGVPIRRELTIVASEAVDLGEIQFAAAVDVPLLLDLPTGRTLPQPLTVIASVVEPDGRSHFGVHVRLEVDADGRAWLRGLSPGSYRLQIGVQGLEPLELALEVTDPPQTQRLTFRAAR